MCTGRPPSAGGRYHGMSSSTKASVPMLVFVRRATVVLFPFVVVILLAACSSQPRIAAPAPHPDLPPLFDDLEHRSFNYFWELGNPANGLVPDRWPSKSFSSIAAVGFGLTA